MLQEAELRGKATLGLLSLHDIFHLPQMCDMVLKGLMFPSWVLPFISFALPLFKLGKRKFTMCHFILEGYKDFCLFVCLEYGGPHSCSLSSNINSELLSLKKK